MSHLNISLLGSPQVAIDGVPIKIPSARLFPLLSYLAIMDGSQNRETLANLLWPEHDLTKALASLRTTLWRLKSTGLEDWIRLENNEVSLNYQKTIEVDTLEFRAKLHKCSTHGHPISHICLYCIPALTDAIQLYRGDFLAGFNLTKSQTFDDWRMQESESLQLLYIDALEKLVRGQRTFGDFNLAIHYARLLLRQDRYNETAQHDLLQLYFITGQRTAAINHYKHYKNLLSRELKIEPPEEITALYKQILGGHLSPVSAQKATTPVFLVADIENPILYFSKAGENKDDILATYHNIFAESSKRFGGKILQKSEGNVSILFENGQPLHAAVTIHLKMSKADWLQLGPPNVRMVLYSTMADENYSHNFSMTARVANNLLSVSWGGQILFSEQTMKALDQLPGSSMKDLGLHQLNDVKNPLHVYQLIHPHLPTVDHRQLQSGKQLLVNFPKFSPTFIGREKELNELSDILEFADNKLISLVGPGGVGKTRLAIQFAYKVANAFPDGVFFFSLAHIQDPKLIPIVLADTLKFTFFGPKDHSEQLANYLHRMQALLVFDNFEHLRQEGVKLLTYLLSQTHNIKIMVTTRERLNLISESILEVHGLPVPASPTVENVEFYSSIRLFLQNAQRISPRFTLEKNLPAVIRICQMVEGLPLGIILASTWVRVFTCTQIAEEIGKNLDFLTTSASDLPTRHRSLRAVFESSWVLLNEGERPFLRKLSVFKSSFTAQAAQEICATTPEGLASLLDKSLLHFHNERYEMHETFRQYVLSKLVGNEQEYLELKNRYIDYFADYCEQRRHSLFGSRQHLVLVDFTTEFENIHTAWDWMVETGRWEVFSKFKEPLFAHIVMSRNTLKGQELYRSALEVLERNADPDLILLTANIRQQEAYASIKIGFIVEALPRLSDSLVVFRRLNEVKDTILTLRFMAEGNHSLGNLEVAKKCVNEAISLIRENDIAGSSNMEGIAALCQSVLGSILIDLGDLDQAKEKLHAGLAVHHKLGTHYGKILPLRRLATIAFRQGDFLQSKELFLNALELATELRDQRSMAVIHNNISAVFENLGSPTEAYHHLLISLDLCKETGDQHLHALILNNIAHLQVQYLHRPSEAIHTYQESIELFSTLGDLRGIVFSYYDISKAYLEVGLIDEAWDHCAKSLRTAMAMDNLPLVIHTLHGFAYLYTHGGQFERALNLCCFLENLPAIESDTQKRVIVTRAELESKLPTQVIDSACQDAKSTNLQEQIDLLLSGKPSQKI